MEFLTASYINTSTAISVDSNTTTAVQILDRDQTLQWTSDGFDDDTLTSVVTYDFGVTLPVSRIAICGMNLKAFDIYYNGVTANTFTLLGDTTTSQWSNNSNSAMFLRTNTVSCRTVTFEMHSTQLANSEKALGWVAISDLLLDFERIPSAKDYKPMIEGFEISHVMTTGRRRIHSMGKTFAANIAFDYISKAHRDELFAVWKPRNDFIFCAFGTSTGWDEMAFPCLWSGNFEFYRYSDDASDAGFSGTIRLIEAQI